MFVIIYQPQDAAFISFHVRSWGLRPEKQSPLYSSGRLMVGHQVHILDTRFESSGCNHCGVEKLVTRQPHKLEIPGSSPGPRYQGC